MKKFNFKGDIINFSAGMEVLKKRLNFEFSKVGVCINVLKGGDGLEISGEGDYYEIKYKEKIHFFRALGIVCAQCGEKIVLKEKPNFSSNGIMIDASRNAVMTVKSIKNMLEIMAIMGLNLIMLYTEDTFEVPGYPYFGYMRGRYTYDELKECDMYADMFGIEMMPCIQTLAHLAKVLKWDNGLNIKDTASVLCVGNDDTYKFIYDMMKAASKPFKSRRIHIGMDEAWDLGLGRYLMENGYKSAQSLIEEHFKRVTSIADELGLETMMWSDMYFRSGSKTNDYYDYDMSFSKEVIASVPKNQRLVYWDYYHERKEEYDKMIVNHKKLSNNIVFAGGIWLWGSMCVNYRKTLRCAAAALSSCIEHGIDTVFATLWGDDGNQTNVFCALYGMQIYAEMGYSNTADIAQTDRRFAMCTAESGEAFRQLGLPDDFGQKEDVTANPSAYLLWQDILTGLMDSHINVENISQFYGNLKKIFAENSKKSKNFALLFDCSYHLANVLEIKADLGVRIKRSYDQNDLQELRNICDCVLPDLKERVQAFKEVYRKLWFEVYKPFGYEAFDMKAGTLLARIETAILRIDEYLAGKISNIEELEQKRLYYRPDVPPWERTAEKTDLNLRAVGYLNYANAAYCTQGPYEG